MADTSMHPALQRILQDDGAAQAFAVLTEQLAGADLTTLLLGVFAERAARVDSAQVLRQQSQDRFVAPSPVDALTLAQVELAALDAAAPEFTPLALAPVAPLGTHFAMGGTPQNNVVSTARGTEVTADPTNCLAIEAALRRTELLAVDAKSVEPVQLAAVHRVTRAQHFEGPRSFAHFSQLGLVSSGRDQGNFAFELDRLQAQITVLIRLVRSFTAAPIDIQITPLKAEVRAACDVLCEDSSTATVEWGLWLEREHGRGYYRTVCFKLNVHMAHERFEIGDGGDVDWTQQLLASRKERLVTGGLGLERLAMLISEYGRS